MVKNSKRKKTTGSIARNFHQGSRSEYLAQYFFTAFGTSVPTPRQEDSGIDLHCTLGEVRGKLLFVSNYFSVQVKSTTEAIEYHSQKSCDWLLSHNYPFIVCVVNKKENQIELYQTAQLSRLFPKSNINCIVLRFAPKDIDKDDYLLEPSPSKRIILLGNPIIRVNISKLCDSYEVEKYRIILKKWIELDYANISRRQMGLNATVFPKRIVTNSLADEENEFKGNFKTHLESSQKGTYYENLWFFLANEISIAASSMQKEKFEAVADLSSFVLRNIDIKDSYGIRVLQTAINQGSDHVGSTRHLTLEKKDSAR